MKECEHLFGFCGDEVSGIPETQGEAPMTAWVDGEQIPLAKRWSHLPCLVSQSDPFVGKHATFVPGGDNLADDPYKGKRVKVIDRFINCGGESFIVQTESGVEFVVFPFELENWS